MSCKLEEKTTLLREGGRDGGRGCVWCGRKETGESGEWVEVEVGRITVNEKMYVIWNAWRVRVLWKTGSRREWRRDGDGGEGNVDDSEWEDVIIWNAWEGWQI